MNTPFTSILGGIMTLQSEIPRPRQLMPTLGALLMEKEVILGRMIGTRQPPIHPSEGPDLEARLCVIDALIISREAMDACPPLP